MECIVSQTNHKQVEYAALNQLRLVDFEGVWGPQIVVGPVNHININDMSHFPPMTMFHVRKS